MDKQKRIEELEKEIRYYRRYMAQLDIPDDPTFKGLLKGAERELKKVVAITACQREILESLAGHSRYSFVFYRKGSAIQALVRRGYVRRGPREMLYITYEGREALRESAGG